MFVPVTISAQSFTVAAPPLETHVVTGLVVRILQHKRVQNYFGCLLLLVLVVAVYSYRHPQRCLHKEVLISRYQVIGFHRLAFTLVWIL